MTRWEPVIMAGLGAAAAALDPSLTIAPLIVNVTKAFIGGAVGAYFGNRVNNYRANMKELKNSNAQSQSEVKEDEQTRGS